VSALVAERGGARIHWTRARLPTSRCGRVSTICDGHAHAGWSRRGGVAPQPRLVATYEELGIAQGGPVQAGFCGIRPRSARPVPNLRPWDVHRYRVFRRAGLPRPFTLPLRKRVAAAQLDATKARVGSTVLELTAQVRQVMVTLQAAQATVEVRKLCARGPGAAAELRVRQRAVGNVSELDVHPGAGVLRAEQVDLGQAKSRPSSSRAVERLLGLWGADSAPGRSRAGSRTRPSGIPRSTMSSP